jgi:hypothetical protein
MTRPLSKITKRKLSTQRPDYPAVLPEILSSRSLDYEIEKMLD